MPATQFIVLIIVLALLFDFLNGMNDAANSIATIVSTRVLSPRMAVAWAAFFNFAAAFGFGVGEVFLGGGTWSIPGENPKSGGRIARADGE